MSIDLNKTLIKINDKVISNSITELSLSLLVLTDKGRIPSTMPYIVFQTLSEVGDFFGILSDEYNGAKIYFNGFKNSDIYPKEIIFGKLMNTAATAWYMGNMPATIDELKAVTDGSLNITATVEAGTSTVYTISGVDLSSANSYSDIASTISAAITTAGASQLSMIFDGTYNRFILNNSISGEKSKIIQVTNGTSGTNLSIMLGLDITLNPIINNGYEAMSGADNIANIVSYYKNFISVAIAKSVDADFQVSLATQLQTYGTRYVFIPYTNNINCLSPNDMTQIAYLCKDIPGVIPTYGLFDHACFIGGIGASIDYSAENSTITWAYKSTDNLPSVVNNEKDYNTLIKNGYNVYAIFGSVTNEYQFLQEGVITGNYKYIDSYYNQVWLKSLLTDKLALMFQDNKRLPYTDIGLTIIESVITNTMQTGLNNGVIDIGVTLDQDTQDQINRDAGRIITPTLYEKGFFVLVLQPSQNNRINRESPIMDVWYTTGGSVQKTSLDLSQIQ